MAIEPISSSATDGERLGMALKRAREERDLTLSEIAASTKVPRASLEMLERGDLSGLPAEVFVRGFIRSYAKAVALAENEPLALYDRAIKARTEATREEAAKPVVDPAIAGLAAYDDREGEGDGTTAQRRGLGLAVFVIILLLIATITLSLLLRRPPQSGEGLSQASPPAPAMNISPPAGASSAATSATTFVIA